MHAVPPQDLHLQEAWIEGDPGARWRSAGAHGPGTGAEASGSSILEIAPGCRLARHSDSAEETIVVITGTATVEIDDEAAEVGAGGIAVVPRDRPHEVRNSGEGPLRFAAVYATADVTTTYARAVEPDGERERGSTA